MHDTTVGHGIFNGVFELPQKYNLSLSKLNFIATDSSLSITRKNTDFVTLLQQKLIEIQCSKLPHTHCIVHQKFYAVREIKMENFCHI